MVKSSLLALLMVSTAVAAASINFTEAKTLADRDEGSLSAEQSHALVQAQAPLVSAALSACLGAVALPPPPFVVVVELDATGAVSHTWRSDDSTLASCFEAVVAKAKLMPPPRSPFYSSFEMDLSSGGGH